MPTFYSPLSKKMYLCKIGYVMKAKTTSYLILLIFALLTIAARGQSIVKLDIDTVVCMADTVRISVGKQAWHNVQLADGVPTSVAVAKRRMIPNGTDCLPDGCELKTTFAVGGYDDADTVNSAEVIDYLRLKIEHGEQRDLYIALTCPNGQTVDIDRLATPGGTTSCALSLPDSSHGFDLSLPVATLLKLGNPSTVGHDLPHSSCDSILLPPGTGWNYCWSNAQTHGITYANDDARIYRPSNVDFDWSTDSSIVATRTRFYRPAGSFNSLIGCPLNGNWELTVIDGNNNYYDGYQFEAELSLWPHSVAHADVMGEWSQPTSDTSFIITAPWGMQHDTTLQFTMRVRNWLGGFVDSTFSVRFMMPTASQADTSLCSGDTLMWMGQPITTDTTLQQRLTAANGCDSVHTLHVHFKSTYHLADTVYRCPRQMPTPAWIDTVMTTVDGCDSTLRLQFLLLKDFEPLILLSTDSINWDSNATLIGCNPMHLYLRDTTSQLMSRLWTIADTDTFSAASFHYRFDSVGTYNIGLKIVYDTGCQASRNIMQAVQVLESPKAEFDWHREIPAMSNPETQFVNLSSPNDITYLWNIQTAGGTDTTSEKHPFYHWGEPSDDMTGSYSVQLIANWTHLLSDTLEHVCHDTAEHVVTIVNDFLQFPNVVTPNGDGINDRWEVVNLVEFGVYPMNEVWIYSIWGQLVFHAKNVSRKEEWWDPEANHDPDGTYYFRFLAKSEYGIVKRNGSIEVTRGK